MYDLQVHSVNVCPLRCALCRQRSAHTDVLIPLPHQNDAVQVFLSLRPGFMDEFLGPTTAGGKKAKKGTSGLDMVDMCVFLSSSLRLSFFCAKGADIMRWWVGWATSTHSTRRTRARTWRWRSTLALTCVPLSLMPFRDYRG